MGRGKNEDCFFLGSTKKCALFSPGNVRDDDFNNFILRPRWTHRLSAFFVFLLVVELRFSSRSAAARWQSCTPSSIFIDRFGLDSVTDFFFFFFFLAA